VDIVGFFVCLLTEGGIMQVHDLRVQQASVDALKPAVYNPRKWSDKQLSDLKESITRFGMVDPIIVNGAKGREGIVIGGHMRLAACKSLNITEVPIVHVYITDIEREKELNLRLNKNQGEFNLELLAEFSEELLTEIGFSSEERDDVFGVEEKTEMFDLEKELKKLNIETIEMQKGDLWQLGDSRMIIGDSTIEEDVLKLMGEERADMCLTDPPYILDYLKAKRHGEAVTGFGAKKNRRYLETDVLPPDFTEKWMASVAKVQKPDFSIIIYENPKNLRTIWNEMEKHWKYRNTITWHLPNRVQGFSAKYKFFNKSDIALVGTGGNVALNTEPEPDELFQNEYENALFATSGKPYWEGYAKGKKYQPTDFIEYVAADEKSSGQGIIFGTKPVEILIPYIKVLTKRGDLIIEPFGGSGSTLIAATKMKRRCYLVEKSPIYAEVIRNRWEKLTGQKAVKIGGKNEK
jgi:DNA modification methylase